MTQDPFSNIHPMFNPYQDGRIKVASISERDILAVLQGRLRISWSGLPEDAFVSRVYYSPDTMAVRVVIASREFSQVPEGEEIPWMGPAILEVVNGAG